MFSSHKYLCICNHFILFLSAGPTSGFSTSANPVFGLEGFYLKYMEGDSTFKSVSIVPGKYHVSVKGWIIFKKSKMLVPHNWDIGIFQWKFTLPVPCSRQFDNVGWNQLHSNCIGLINTCSTAHFLYVKYWQAECLLTTDICLYLFLNKDDLHELPNKKLIDGYRNKFTHLIMD